MRIIRAPIAAAILASASFGLAASATAQEAPATDAQAAAPATASQAATPATGATVSDEQVRKFALALVEVTKLQKQYEPRIQSASDAEKPAIAQEVNAQMAAAVTAQGLDAQTFNAIGQTAQQDAALSQKIHEEVQKAQPSQ